MAIHPSAVVADGAVLGENCEIGPFCVIGADVSLGAGCHLHSHVVVEGHTSLGAGCEVFPFACLGGRTQDLKYVGGNCRVEIGDETVIREYVTVNAATADGGVTRVGSRCLLQSSVHVAHECVLGDDVIISTGTGISGHVEIGDAAVLSGHVGVVQFVKIGKMAFVGGYSKLAQDVLPYCVADGMPAVHRAVNRVGMERHGRDGDTIRAVAEAYKLIIRSGTPLEQAREQLAAADPCKEICDILTFTADTKTGLARPRS
jgi:UDP-N-acetylglucosamine acyltransferase